MTPSVRLGIIGLGNMGSGHARMLMEGRIPRLELAAGCDHEESRRTPWQNKIPVFSRVQDLLKSGLVDAVLIATPHYDHPVSGAAALKAGLHVLVEKPIAVHTAAARQLLAAHRDPKQIFAAMFNQRTDPCYRAIKALLEAGDLGTVQRVNWTITNWYRTEAYYRSGGWRATWAGEGGGVLLNQCPHNLDLFQWLFGMPQRVRAFAGFGKYHAIEVEDEVTAYLEYDQGCTATFITSTGETPGTNRLEIAGDLGRLVCEDGRIHFLRNGMSTREHLRTCPAPFDRPASTEIPIPISGTGGQHAEILTNFANAILDGTPLIAPAEEGIHSVDLANAMLLSADRGRTVDLPLSPAVYARWLKKKAAAGQKLATVPHQESAPVDMSQSFPTPKRT